MPNQYIITSEIKERFEKFISIEPITGCWLYIGAWDGHGYGQFSMAPPRRLITAHRFSYELYIGPIPEGMDVLHYCDTPPCCSPYHIFPGTQLDNMRDMVKKGRYRCGNHKGEINGSTKLTENIVREILTGKDKGTELAKRCGVNVSTIYRVRHHKTWAHIGGSSGS
jgi:hypothetical protein